MDCTHLNCYSFRIYKVTRACDVTIFQGEEGSKLPTAETQLRSPGGAHQAAAAPALPPSQERFPSWGGAP